MQLLMQVISPFGTVSYIIDKAMIGNKFTRAAFTCVAPQFHFTDDLIGDVHTKIINGICNKNSRLGAGVFIVRTFPPFC